MLENFKEQLQIAKTITLKIKVHAPAKLSRIKSILSDGTIKIDIAQAPEDGKANDKLIALLADEFEVKKSGVTIMSGKFSGDKIVVIKLL